MADNQAVRMDPGVYSSPAVPLDSGLPGQSRRPVIPTSGLPSGGGLAHRSPAGPQPYIKADTKSPETSRRLDDVMLQYQQQQQQKLLHQNQYTHPSQTLLQQGVPQDHYLASHPYVGGSAGGRMMVRDVAAAGGKYPSSYLPVYSGRFNDFDVHTGSSSNRM